MWVFIVFYGLDWWRPCRPRSRCAARTSGWRTPAVVFGWVFASHMVGAGVGASFAGFVRQEAGDYFAAWMTAGGLCLGAAALCLLMPRHAVEHVDTATTAQMEPLNNRPRVSSFGGKLVAKQFGTFSTASVKSDGLAVGRSLPVSPYQETFSDTDGMSQRCHEHKYFYYLAIRQANSTTVAPSAAAITDVTIPPPSTRSTAM